MCSMTFSVCSSIDCHFSSLPSSLILWVFGIFYFILFIFFNSIFLSSRKKQDREKMQMLLSSLCWAVGRQMQKQTWHVFTVEEWSCLCITADMKWESEAMWPGSTVLVRLINLQTQNNTVKIVCRIYNNVTDHTDGLASILVSYRNESIKMSRTFISPSLENNHIPIILTYAAEMPHFAFIYFFPHIYIFATQAS